MSLKQTIPAMESKDEDHNATDGESTSPICSSKKYSEMAKSKPKTTGSSRQSLILEDILQTMERRKGGLTVEIGPK